MVMMVGKIHLLLMSVAQSLNLRDQKGGGVSHHRLLPVEMEVVMKMIKMGNGMLGLHQLGWLEAQKCLSGAEVACGVTLDMAVGVVGMVSIPAAA